MNNTNINLEKSKPKIPYGQRIAEKVASIVGSWKFIIFQTIVLFVWVILNVTAMIGFSWDPYPFILMNLFLSLQAAYTAPLILIANNRQSEKDRQVLYNDYTIDKHTNKVINIVNKHLQMQDDKIDLLLEKENIKFVPNEEE